MRPLGTLLACLAVLWLGGCQLFHAPGRGGASRLEGILESRELRVGLSGSQPPLNMTNKRGQIIGLEVDLIEALAEAMGLRVRLVQRPFGELLSALENGEVDLVISGMTITAERNARVAFVGPYFISGKSVLTLSDTIARVDSSTQLDSPERTYVAVAGSTSEDFVKRVLPSAQLLTTPDHDTAIQMVLDSKVDALIADFPICSVAVLRYPEAGLSVLMTPFTIEPLGIALPADDPLLVNLVGNYLTTLEETGLLTRFKAKWFSNEAWLSELP